MSVRIGDDEIAFDWRALSDELEKSEVAEDTGVWIAHPELEVESVSRDVVSEIMDHQVASFHSSDGDLLTDLELRRNDILYGDDLFFFVVFITVSDNYYRDKDDQ